ncbi:MAG: hypothetical protein ACYSSI_11620, partial [Planctomycetota bacterium]
MRMAKGMCVGMLVVLCVLGLWGCGKSEEGIIEIEVNESRPLSEIKNEAKKMNVEQLKEAAVVYKKAVAAKAQEGKELLGKMAGIVTAKTSKEEMEAIKNNIKSVDDSMAGL